MDRDTAWALGLSLPQSISTAYRSNKSPKKVWKKWAIYEHIPTHNQPTNVPTTCQTILFSTTTRAMPGVVRGTSCSLNSWDCRSPILSLLLKALLKRTPVVLRPSCIHDYELKATKLQLRWDSWKGSVQMALLSGVFNRENWRLKKQNSEAHSEKKQFAHKHETREAGRMKPECTG